MKIIVAKDYEQMSQIAAMDLMGWIVKGKTERVNLSITGGSTPERMYEIIHEFMKDNQFENVHYYNFDEIPVKGATGVTYATLDRVFFTPNNIAANQIEKFDETNYEGYDYKLAADGGIDMIMIGLGPDGHFCGNLSGTVNGFEEGCRAVDNHLNQKLADRIAFLTGGEDKMTDYYVTFGPKSVMQCRRIVMIVNGKKKADILRKVLLEPICLEVPSSILRLHPDFTIIADEEALSAISEEELKSLY